MVKAFYSCLESKKKKTTFPNKNSLELVSANKSRILYLGSSLEENFDPRLAKKKKRLDFNK